MELSQVSMRPAKVLKVVDVVGTIKVSAPGVFAETEDPELLPPVYPLFSVSSNTFSTPLVGDDVWLLTIRNNPEELFYLRMVDHKNIMNNIGDINSNGEIECLLRKPSNTGWGELYFSTGEGWVVSNGGCKAVIDNAGNINLVGKSVKLGSSSAADPACKYNELEFALKIICNLFSSIGSTSSSISPQINAAIQGLLPTLQAQIPRIKSEKVYIER